MGLAPGPILAETLLRAVRAPVSPRAPDLIANCPREAGIAAADVRLDAAAVEAGVVRAQGLAEVLRVGGVALAAPGVVHHPGDVLRLPAG